MAIGPALRSANPSRRPASTPAAPIPGDLTKALIKASRLTAGERVLVMGNGVARHLLGLAQWGCGAAAGCRADGRILAREAAEVIWLTGFDESATLLDLLSTDLGPVRLVAFDLAAESDLDGLSACLRLLATKGLACCAYHPVGDRLVVTAARPAWLRWVS